MLLPVFFLVLAMILCDKLFVLTRWSTFVIKFKILVLVVRSRNIMHQFVFVGIACVRFNISNTLYINLFFSSRNLALAFMCNIDSFLYVFNKSGLGHKLLSLSESSYKPFSKFKCWLLKKKVITVPMLYIREAWSSSYTLDSYYLEESNFFFQCTPMSQTSLECFFKHLTTTVESLGGKLK